MTELKCNATTCQSNCHGLCALNTIHVDGSTAEKPQETCCGSFTAKVSSMVNSANHIDVRPETRIKCHARDCVYNRDMMCAADAVQINGMGADRCGDTQCSTFKAR
ncbi:MAG: DUF1540 domain-containing protein [Clostridia bacterium]|nr:DUF1540 domain-containing protein [Clostridia bacterium]